jgi:putative spermidine/putrescine transport system ATP-binding protein
MNDTVHVSIRNVSKIFGNGGIQALKNINLEINEGEILVLLGPSGCGKSTLLRIIAGLEKSNQGEVYFYDKDISALPAERRNAGFVFQNYALFPTMTVRENISFGLKIRKFKRKDIKTRVDKLLDMMSLNDFAERKPAQLSGGQQQRAAIARALATEPKILLMDEPLNALDAKLKEYLRIELALLFRRLGITTIYVTHDQIEAMAIADRIAVMNKGLIEQVDLPEKIYTSPKTGFIAQFIGRINRLQGAIVNENGEYFIGIGSTKIPIKTPDYEGGKTNVFIRPEDITIAADDEDCPGIIEANVLQSVFMGDHCHINADVSGQEFAFSVKNDKKPAPGALIRIKLDMSKLILL